MKRIKIVSIKDIKAKLTPKSYGIIGVVLLVVLAGSAGFWKWHETPQFCGTCHKVMAKYVESYYTPGILANLHREKGKTCLDCHPFMWM